MSTIETTHQIEAGTLKIRWISPVSLYDHVDKHNSEELSENCILSEQLVVHELVKRANELAVQDFAAMVDSSLDVKLELEWKNASSDSPATPYLFSSVIIDVVDNMLNEHKSAISKVLKEQLASTVRNMTRTERLALLVSMLHA